MSKLKTNDVRYIVLEGGGARGAAYLGAIKGLQREFDRTKGAPGSTFELAQGVAEKCEENALLDYVSCNDGKRKILGVAGSSAGAITSYALALGLNAKDIEEYVMKFEFKNFLSSDQEKTGKYRMIDAEGNLMIGEDGKKKADQKRNRKKIVGARKDKFEFVFDKNETKVAPNVWKQSKRIGISYMIVKSILDGVATNLERWGVYGTRILGYPVGLTQFNRMLNSMGQDVLTSSLAANLPTIINGIKSDSPIKLSYENINNALFDSGMFSGFKVREFFYDVTIFAATRETHFRRCLIKAANDGKIMGFHDCLESKELDFRDFKIGKRSETTFPDKILPVLKYLQHMTFQQLYDVTGVEFAVCVSNLTSNLPLYFSHKWTPDFRVQEAVGASMTIPPAIKPLYNESEVCSRGLNKSIRIKAWGTENGQQFVHTFVDSKGNFSTADYHRYEHVMKKALQKMMEEKNVWISTNNVTDISTFLPILRDLVVGEYDEITGKYKKPEHGEYTIAVEGITYSFGDELFHFYYNAAYFGMFVDGGYRCNIPYNIFRKSNLQTTEELKQTLAIKLDGGFPAVLIARLMDQLSDVKSLEEYIQSVIEDNRINAKAFPPEFRQIADILTEIWNNELSEPTEMVTRKAVRSDIIGKKKLKKRAGEIVADFYRNEVSEDLIRQLRNSDSAINKLMIALRSSYKQLFYAKPWEVRKGISVPMAEGYSYGSELGQLRFMSDHNYIIPLYSCGIGTFDFDLEKVITLVKLSQEVSEKAIEAYFSNSSSGND